MQNLIDITFRIHVLLLMCVSALHKFIGGQTINVHDLFIIMVSHCTKISSSSIRTFSLLVDSSAQIRTSILSDIWVGICTLNYGGDLVPLQQVPSHCCPSQSGSLVKISEGMNPLLGYPDSQ